MCADVCTKIWMANVKTRSFWITKSMNWKEKMWSSPRKTKKFVLLIWRSPKATFHRLGATKIRIGTWESSSFRTEPRRIATPTRKWTANEEPNGCDQSRMDRQDQQPRTSSKKGHSTASLSRTRPFNRLMNRMRNWRLNWTVLSAWRNNTKKSRRITLNSNVPKVTCTRNIKN